MDKLTFLLIVIIISSFLLADYPYLQQENYEHELVKFYLNRNEYDLAIGVIDSLKFEAAYPDSLQYFKALAFIGKKQWSSASDTLAKLITETSNNSLRVMALKQYNKAIKNIEPTAAIEKISSIISLTKSDSLNHDLLFLISEIYEQNNLYEEANDIYRSLLSDSLYTDSLKVIRKIAINEIFIKDYQAADNYLDRILVEADSLYRKDALFFSYIANYSLEKYDKAKKMLIELYQKYPEHEEKKQILRSLAVIYQKQKQYLLSWFFWQKLQLISTAEKQVEISKKINSIRSEIGNNSELPDQFQILQPQWNK
jgi:tetratricopeptide (TPR) repeat protein